IYPDDMKALGASTNSANSFTMPQDATSYKIEKKGSVYKQNSVPVIKMEQGSMFSLRYLPTISVKEERPDVTWQEGLLFSTTTTVTGFSYDLMYLIPWQNAKVYYVADRNNSAMWNPLNGSMGTLVSGGVGAITTDQSRVGGRYTLVTNMNFDGRTVTVYCSIDVI
ncbi:MAG: hypothetical protein J6V83_05390, partial [Clostridia bacterium]|nr:hypothetical protein [Clostridia bacterium]